MWYTDISVHDIENTTMSTQGSISCKNGFRGEDIVKRCLDVAGITYKEQYATTFGTIVDFVIGSAAVEVKYHSGQPGTIWHKYHRTIYRMKDWPGKKIMVVAGEKHSAKVFKELEEFGSIFEVAVVTDDKLLGALS
jgi:hypothetical protein